MAQCKESVCQCRRCQRRGFDPWVRKIRWSRKWQPASVFLSGKSHKQRCLAGCRPWGHKESGTTEQLSTHTIDILLLFGDLSYANRKKKSQNWALIDQNQPGCKKMPLQICLLGALSSMTSQTSPPKRFNSEAGCLLNIVDRYSSRDICLCIYSVKKYREFFLLYFSFFPKLLGLAILHSFFDCKT